MAEELQALKELVAQLREDNEKLRREQASANAVVGGTSNGAATRDPTLTNSGAAALPIAERLVFIPRERACPMFGGKPGQRLSEWLEEAQASMRVRHLEGIDKADFLYDHLEGEAREEIKYRPRADQRDPVRIIAILKELYGCTDSYVALQEAFFSRRQQEGETLQEFSLGLMKLMAKVKGQAPDGMPNAETLLRDQFAEHVLDGALRRELKQMVRRQPTVTLLEVRGEAMRWEREGLPSSMRGRSHSVPSAIGIQYQVQGKPCDLPQAPPSSEVSDMKEMLKLQQEQLRCQQEQLQQLTQSIAQLQRSSMRSRSPRNGPLICRRCQQPGHFASECDGVRVPPRPQASGLNSPSGSQVSRNSASGN